MQMIFNVVIGAVVAALSLSWIRERVRRYLESG